MIRGLRSWYAGLTRREQRYISVLAALVAVLLLIYGIILPIIAAHGAAEQRHRSAVAQSGRVMADLRLLDAAPARPAGPLEGPLHMFIAASAEAQGFVLQANQPRGDVATTIVVPAAVPTAALAWLNGLEARGIQIETATITPAADGRVAINASLQRPAQGITQ